MWKDKYFETKVLTASPLELVVILYQHTIISVQDARKHLLARDIPSRNLAVCKALRLVTELLTSLNHEAGGPLSRNLEGLYKYMQYRLTEGNIMQQEQPFAEVESLLEQLLEGWTGIARASDAQTTYAESAETATESQQTPWNMPFATPEHGTSTSCWSA